MAGRFQRVILNYLQNNLGLYLIVFSFFLLGIFAGALLVKPLIVGQQLDLLAYLDNFISSLLSLEITSTGIFKQALTGNLKLFSYIWLLGLTVIGVPVIVGLVFARGFVLGFTVGFLVQEKGIQGISIALFSVLPPNLLLIPAILIGAVSAISFSLILIKGNIKNTFLKLLQQFIAYSLLMLVVILISVLAALIEAYVAPAMMKLIAVYI